MWFGIPLSLLAIILLINRFISMVLIERRNMKQTTQQVIQKPNLPIKTKIAAWWLIIIGVIGLIFSVWNILSYLLIFFRESWGQESGRALIGSLSFGVIVLLSLFFLLPGIFLLRKKRWAWWIIIVLLIFPSIYMWYFTLVPIVLFLLDRKNFFKIAS